MVDLLQLRMSYRGHTKYFPISYTTGDPHVNSNETRHLPIQVYSVHTSLYCMYIMYDCIIMLHVYITGNIIYISVLRRKKERSKQGQTNKQGFS